MELEEGYALQYNDPAMIELVDKAVNGAEAAGREYIEKPFSGSEDFSFFGKLTGTPSAFMMIDAGRGDELVSLHNGKIVFNEGGHQARRHRPDRHRAGISESVICFLTIGI